MKISMLNRFKEMREQKGITIDKASVDTRISSKLLKAIEEDDFTIFPAEIYLKGFITLYANYLGLNPKEILEEYKKSKE